MKKIVFYYILFFFDVLFLFSQDASSNISKDTCIFNVSSEVLDKLVKNFSECKNCKTLKLFSIYIKKNKKIKRKKILVIKKYKTYLRELEELMENYIEKCKPNKNIKANINSFKNFINYA